MGEPPAASALAGVVIEELSPDDWQRARAIRLACLKDAPYAFGSTYEEEVQQPQEWWRKRLVDGRWFIARQAERDLSVAMLIHGPLPETFSSNGALNMDLEASYPWIRSVFTVPEARGRKLVDLLCLHLCDLVATQGHQIMVLGVRQNNDRAHAAYLRMNFIDIGTFVPTSAPAEMANHLMARVTST